MNTGAFYKIILPLTLAFALLSVGYTNCSSRQGQNSQSDNLNSLASCEGLPAPLSAPETIESVVELINALPKPTSLSCFMRAMKRPLHIYATLSQASVQPAAGERSPRIFLIRGNLILAVVPEGSAKNGLEISQIKETGRTLKAEITFPVMERIERSAPFAQISEGSGSSCVSCHSSESRDPSVMYANAFVSSAIRPNPVLKASVPFLREETKICDPNVEPSRCNLLRSIFEYGQVIETEFPVAIP